MTHLEHQITERKTHRSLRQQIWNNSKLWEIFEGMVDPFHDPLRSPESLWEVAGANGWPATQHWNSDNRCTLTVEKKFPDESHNETIIFTFTRNNENEIERPWHVQFHIVDSAMPDGFVPQS